MIILSDNHDTAVDFLTNDISDFSNRKSLPIPIEIIEKSLFRELNCKLYKSNDSDYWEYLFLTKHARESQFDVINSLISRNIQLPDKLICLAEKGDGFHGFRNRSWSAEKGNIHLTVFFEPQQTFEHFHAGLLIVAAVSVLQTIDLIPDLNGKAKTKWVNDIIINNSKVSGIITQSFSTGNNISGAVIGIGLNVLTEPKFKKDIFTQSASSLLSYSDVKECNIKFIFNKLLSNLSKNIELLKNDNYNSLLKIYCDRSGVIGKNVEIYSDPINGKIKSIITGKVIDINENLELIIENYPIPVKSGRLALTDLH